LARITNVRTRLFSCATDGPTASHANPLRAWQGAEASEASFRFHEWLIVEIELEDGTIGIGNAALAPRVAAQIVNDYLAPLLVGRDSRARESNWQLLFRSTVAFARGGVGMAALSAIDIALWDAQGKRLGVPVYELLGGLKHPTIPVYASQLYPSDDLEALAIEARGYAEAGFGMVKQRLLCGPAEGREGMKRNVELVRTVRDAIGDNVDLAVDVYMGWDLDYASRMLRLLEPFGLRWLEEPLLPNDLNGYRTLRSKGIIPIAGGEHEATLSGFAELIASGAVDIAQPDVNRVGGVTVAQKICAVAEAAGIPVIPHAGQVHNYHLVASQPAAPMAEFFPINARPLVGNEMTHLLFGGEPVAVDGAIQLSESPGFGVEIAPRKPVLEVDFAV
jgi:L-rhamnonate dehydratase